MERIKYDHIQSDLKTLMIECNGFCVKLNFSQLDNIHALETVKEMLSGTYKAALYGTLANESEKT